MTIATTALTPDLPEEPADEELDVDVSFCGTDFCLIVPWAISTSDDDDDEATVLDVAEWFAETYGFDPAQYAHDTEVNRRQ